jgi:PAS domain S-box-containing protein
MTKNFMASGLASDFNNLLLIILIFLLFLVIVFLQLRQKSIQVNKSETIKSNWLEQAPAYLCTLEKDSLGQWQIIESSNIFIEHFLDLDKPRGQVWPWSAFLARLLPEEAEIHLAEIQENLNKRIPWESTLMARALDNSIKHLQAQCVPDADNRLHILMVDISKQKWIEQALLQSQERFRTLLSSIPEVVCELYVRADEFGPYYLSPQAEEILGYAPWYTIKEWRSRKYLHPDDWKKVTASLPAIYLQQPAFFRQELRFLKPSGQYHWLLFNARLIKKEKNELIYHGIISDTTAFRRLEQAWQKAKQQADFANQAKSEFISRMSHEIRSPLNVILGFTQLLLQGENRTQFSEETLKSIQQIDESGWYLLELLNEILDLSRIEAGRIAVTVQNISIAEVMEECVQMMLPIAKPQNINIEMRLPPKNYCLLSDSLRLRQIFLNLLSNAVKYNIPNGTVYFYCELLKDERIRIVVRDTGIGIAKADLGNLFQPFNRLGQEFGKQQGTGIGLVVTQRLVHLLSGNIGVDSEEGKGTTFWVDFPLFSADVAQIEEAKRESENQLPKITQPVFIFYIDDQISSIQLMQQFLLPYPLLKVQGVLNPQLGLQMARDLIPDIIFLDIRLPGIDGYQVLNQLKSHAETKDIPVVAVSADAMPDQIRRAKAAGFADYLTKPIVLSDLYRVLSTVFFNHSSNFSKQ